MSVLKFIARWENRLWFHLLIVLLFACSSGGCGEERNRRTYHLNRLSIATYAYT